MSDLLGSSRSLSSVDTSRPRRTASGQRAAETQNDLVVLKKTWLPAAAGVPWYV